MLLATATAHPAEIDSVRWLLADDLTLPLHAGLWQCLTTLARRPRTHRPRHGLVGSPAARPAQ